MGRTTKPRELQTEKLNFAVYDNDLIRKLCHDITAEKEPQRFHALIALLQSAIKDDQEEVRVRLAFLRQKYISESNAAD